MRNFAFPLLFLLLQVAPSISGEIFVDVRAKSGGKGTIEAPYQTIGEALKKTAPGTLITIKKGVYRETLSISSGGESGAPLVIRAAPGERVEITGFRAITGWKREGNLAKTTVSHPVYDLCVGQARQPLSRYPDKMSPWISVISADGASMKAGVVPGIPPEEVNGLCLGMLVKDFNADWLVPVAGMDKSSCTLELAGKQNFKIQAGDSFVYCNAPSLIKFPGDWSCQPVHGGYEITFWPKDPLDLEKTQSRASEDVIKINKARYLILHGLEITGAIHTGLFVANSSHINIERCLIYHNGLPGATSPYGIYLDQCENSRVDSCIIYSNYRGLGICQGKDNSVFGCEIASNDGDGVNFTGRRSMREKPALRPTLSHCYIHSHIYLGHADNFQTWGWVEGCEYHHNLSILAAQHMMLENITKLNAANSVLLSGSARLVILGGRYCTNSTFQNMDFLWGNLGSIGLDKDNTGIRISGNVFYANPLNYEGSVPKTGANLFWSPKPGANMITKRDENNKFQTYKNIGDLTAQGFEVGSQQADPRCQNIPQAQGISNAPTKNTRDTLHFSRPGSLDGFSVGDTIELNFDHIPRTIETMTKESLTFKPALPIAPFRDVIVWGWGKRTDLQIDLASPLAGGKNQPGATIDVAAYQRGELDGSGKRSLPELHQEAKAAFPDPAAYTYPFSLPLSYATKGTTTKTAAPPSGPLSE